MEEFIENQVREEKNGIGTAYVLENNELFYDIGYKVMQNLDESCLLKCHRLKYNGKIKLVYFTSEYESIAQVIRRSTPEASQIIIARMFEAFNQIENLGFLDISYVDNRLDNIFVDPVTNVVKIIYLPINIPGRKKNKTIFENEIKAQLNRLEVSVPVNTQAPVQTVATPAHPAQNVAASVQPVQNITASAHPAAQTVQTSPQTNMECIWIQSLDGQIRFQIGHQDFVIGKSKDKVNGVIIGNPAVSRVHCKILYQNGTYFILDMGSSNGTFLDGKRVTATEPLPIQNGSRIRIANIELMVRG